MKYFWKWRKKTIKAEAVSALLPLFPSACYAQLPSPFCCFSACVDVFGTHSNVHLRCFHTGKSTAARASPSPRKSSVIIIIISLICLILISCLFGRRSNGILSVLSMRSSCLDDDVSVIILVVLWFVSACTRGLSSGPERLRVESVLKKANESSHVRREQSVNRSRKGVTQGSDGRMEIICLQDRLKPVGVSVRLVQSDFHNLQELALPPSQ